MNGRDTASCEERRRHVSWEGKRDGGGDEQVYMRLHVFRVGEAHHVAPAV